MHWAQRQRSGLVGFDLHGSWMRRALRTHAPPDRMKTGRAVRFGRYHHVSCRMALHACLRWRGALGGHLNGTLQSASARMNAARPARAGSADLDSSPPVWLVLRCHLFTRRRFACCCVLFTHREHRSGRSGCPRWIWFLPRCIRTLIRAIWAGRVSARSVFCLPALRAHAHASEAWAVRTVRRRDRHLRTTPDAIRLWAGSVAVTGTPISTRRAHRRRTRSGGTRLDRLRPAWYDPTTLGGTLIRQITGERLYSRQAMGELGTLSCVWCALARADPGVWTGRCPGCCCRTARARARTHAGNPAALTGRCHQI
jgi:hypothetical protein